MPRLNYEAWARANNPNYMSQKDRRDRRREIIAYAAEFPFVTAREIALAFEVSYSLAVKYQQQAKCQTKKP